MSLDEKEVKEAVVEIKMYAREELDCNDIPYAHSVSILLDLAQLYLSIAGKLPKEMPGVFVYLKGVEDGKEMVRKALPSENPYPENIFLPIPKEDYKKINELLIKEMGYPLDRLSGNIGRELFEALHARIENNLLKKEPSDGD